MKPEILAALAKAGVTATDVQGPVADLEWSDLHERRKSLRRASETLMAKMPADGANIPADLGGAYELIGGAISRISNELDDREARGTREPQDPGAREAERRAESIAYAQSVARGGRRGSNGAQIVGNALVLPKGASAAAHYGSGRRHHGGAEVDIGDLIRATVTGDFSKVDREATFLRGTGASGGFLIPDEMWGQTLDLARNKMRVVQAGATVVDVGPSGSLTVPTLESDPTAVWRGELQEVAATSATFGQRIFTPATVAVFVNGSIEALDDSPMLGSMVMDTIAAQIAQQVDYAALAGDGVGKPLGVLNASGVQTIDAGGALASYDVFARAVQKVREQNVEPGAIILSPRTLGHVDRLVDTTGQPLQPPPSLRDRAFLDTNQIDVTTSGSPDVASAVIGEWSSQFVVFRQRLVLEITRTGGDNFQTLGWAARGYARVDAFPVRPARFCVIENLPAE